MLPVPVTVPDRLIPFTVPVPLTEVTVPLPVPAPISPLKSAAERAVTVLSALILKKVIALGFVKFNKLLPTVVPNAVFASLYHCVVLDALNANERFTPIWIELFAPRPSIAAPEAGYTFTAFTPRLTTTTFCLE
jgi:hypothetical protein